jgi:hypothetical protein
MFKRFAFAAFAVVALFNYAPSASAADHRDAPTIDDYSAIDINDVFMFRDPSGCAPTTAGCNLVVALSTQAVADPLFGSSYHFQENALYQLNFTTRSDARPTAEIDFVFGPFGNGPDCPAPQPACQTFKAFFPNGNVVEALTTQGTSGATHNSPVIKTVNAHPHGTITVFAGPREDPFFFDLIGFNRTIGSSPAQVLFTGVDAFKGKNINAIVVEFPVDLVFPKDKCSAPTNGVFSTPCGVWAVTYLGNVDGDDNDRDHEHSGNHNHGRSDEHRDQDLRQIDRMGNPAVNTALIPAPLKDAFNFGIPQNDARDFAKVILNQIASLDAKFCPLHPLDCKNPNPNIPLLASVAVPDILRFASNAPDGYPNGRQLADRTTDILISLILQLPGFTDGTSAKTYCSGFPFVGPPLQLSGALPFQINPQSCP